MPAISVVICNAGIQGGLLLLLLLPFRSFVSPPPQASALDMRKAAEWEAMARRVSVAEKQLVEMAASEERLKRALEERERGMEDAQARITQLKKLIKEVRGAGKILPWTFSLGVV